MPAEEPPVLSLPTGLTPLSSGPIPLTAWQGRAWALAILLGTAFLAAGLPWIAAQTAPPASEPDRIAFGSATVVPAAGWVQSGSGPGDGVRLTKSGTWMEFASVPAEGRSAAVRARDLADRMQQEYPQLTVSSAPRPFNTATRTPGQLQALAGTNQTSIVASVVEGGSAVDVTSLGESSQLSRDITQIQQMLESIRIVEVPPP